MHAGLDFCSPVPALRELTALVRLGISIEYGLSMSITLTVRAKTTLEFLCDQNLEALGLRPHLGKDLWVI
jgi:hypothetical protein